MEFMLNQAFVWSSVITTFIFKGLSSILRFPSWQRQQSSENCQSQQNGLFFSLGVLSLSEQEKLPLELQSICRLRRTGQEKKKQETNRTWSLQITQWQLRLNCKRLMCAKIFCKCYWSWDQEAEEEEGDWLWTVTLAAENLVASSSTTLIQGHSQHLHSSLGAEKRGLFLSFTQREFLQHEFPKWEIRSETHRGRICIMGWFPSWPWRAPGHDLWQ